MITIELSKTSISSSSRIHHYALYAWATVDSPNKYFHAAFYCDPTLRGSAYNATRFIREAILDGVGLDACFSRLAAVLRSDDPWHWDRLDDLRCILSVFGNLAVEGDDTEVHSLLLAAGQYHIPQLAVAIARSHSLAGGLRASPGFYNAVFSILM